MSNQIIELWRFYLLVVTLQLYDGGFAFRNPDKAGILHRSDLFMDDSFFLGHPNVDELLQNSEEGLGQIGAFSDVAQQDRIAIYKSVKGKSNPVPVSGRSGNGIPNLESSGWPGRHSDISLTNAASDVVLAYEKNLAMHNQETEASMSKPVPSWLTDAMTRCNQTCGVFDSTGEPTAKSLCLFHCSSIGQEMFETIAYVLNYGLRKICHTTDTLYLKLDKLKIKNFKTFKKIIRIVRNHVRQPVRMNVLLRSAFVTLMRDLQSPISPFSKVNSLFNGILQGTENRLELPGNVLVGAHPGCSMVNIDQPILKMLEVISKEPSLMDYILFQGYALFTAASKYIDEFPTKKGFAVVNQGLDMMLGTSCGIYVYGLFGEKTNCDQFGGYPVLDMPVPEFMWEDKAQVECEKIRKKILLQGKVGEDDKGLEAADINALGSTPTPGEEKRARRSLVVGRSGSRNNKVKWNAM